MATPAVTKIVLRNTTKMSLNERFTAYRSQLQNTTNIRAKLQSQRQAHSANLKLAQQMSNRPTVIAALKLKKRSLQQRLGAGRGTASSNVKARLNFGNRINFYNRPNNNNLQGRLGNMRGRFNNRRRGGFRAGTSPLIRARLGAPQGNFGQQNRGNFRRFQRGNNFQVGNQQNRRNNQGGNQLPASRFARGGRRNNRGGGRGGWVGGRASGQAPPTKQELDNQLDEYMAETKGSLDAQLGQYMSQA